MKRLTLAISVIGIFILLLIIKFQTPEVVDVSSLSLPDVGKEVRINGNIISFREYDNNFKILNVKEENSQDKITVTCNCIEIKSYLNKTLEISGRVEEYNGKLQINAEKISVI